MRFVLIALSCLGFSFATPSVAQNGPVVVELYTSQGCSSCPPADAMLHELAKRDDVIALALHVDYWDYIGWKDAFADPAFSARQHGYARANATRVYTPQMVINGQDEVVGSRAMRVMDLLQAHRASSMPVRVNLSRSGDRIRINAQSPRRGDYLVQLVRYTPQQTVSIRRGENAGRELSYVHIVNSWQVIHEWDGAGALALDAPAAGGDPVVVLIQQRGHGPIVGAAELR